MACDKYIILSVLTVTATVFIVYINLAQMMEQGEPSKTLILTMEQIQSNALKRNRNKIDLKSDKSLITSPINYHGGVLNLHSVEMKVHPFMKMFLNFHTEVTQSENSKSDKVHITSVIRQHNVSILANGELENDYLKVFNNKFEKNNEDREVVQFENYLKRFNKSYSGREWKRRFWNFKQSLNELSLHGSHTGATHGLTKFSDWSKKEFARVMNNPSYRVNSCRNFNLNCMNKYFERSKKTNYFVSHSDHDVSDRLDWREKGNVIGPVLEQKLCNACWAFGIAGLIESMAVIQDIETYHRRSIQELIDCVYENGCNGGHVTHALQYLCFYDIGVETEEQYPLVLVHETCKNETKPDPRKIKGFSTVCNMDEIDILRRLKHGPVIAVINAEPLKNYVEGIIQRSCYRSKDDNSMDHVVQIVGYDRSGKPGYYILKNSWGSDWGEDGYFRLEFGNNLCGVRDEITYLEVY